MNELQTVQLDILREFSHVMKAEGFRWFAMFGTLLGTARCGGFIPWDDDIDVALPRTDYDRLRQSPGLFKEPYFLQTTTNDPAAAPRFMRLRHSGTAIIPEDFPSCYTPGGHMGIYIDIIPLDSVPDIAVAKGIQDMAAALNRRMFASAALDESGFDNGIISKERFCKKDGGLHGFYGYFAELYEKACSGFQEGRYYAMPILRCERGQRVYDKEWFKTSVEMDFEGVKIPIPAGWKETLIVSYPEGLCEPDPRYRKIAKKKTSRLIDVHRSYREYVKPYTDMLTGIENKKTYLFGAGDSLRIWLERYGQGVDIICAFDNDAAKWGKKAYGVLVRNPKDLRGLLDDNSRLIISSIYRKEISAQLDEMGIKDYYFFVDGWNYGRTTRHSKWLNGLC